MTLLQERPTRRFTASLHLRAANGTNPATRKKALIIVTDGVADYGARIIPFSKGPINPNDCSAMKAFGYSVYVLYRPYSDDGLAPPFDNAGLKDHLARVPSVMDTNLQQCAPDPGNFKDASTSADIIAGLNQLLLSAIGSAGRFTQEPPSRLPGGQGAALDPATASRPLHTFQVRMFKTLPE